MVEAAGKLQQVRVQVDQIVTHSKMVEAAGRLQQARVQVDQKVTVGWWRQQA
jgi:hypothetical protein